MSRVSGFLRQKVMGALALSNTVWISIAPGQAMNMRPFINSFAGTEQAKEGMAWGERNSAGDPLRSECFPSEIFGTPDAKESAYRLPDIFSDGNFWVASQAAADVFSQFDLGNGALYPVKVLKKDRQTPVGGDWFCINFGNRKDGVLVPDSVPMRETYVYGGKKAWRLKSVLADNDLAVRKPAQDWPDIWIDPQIAYSFFLSERLGNALRSAKADKGFLLHKCRVI